MSEESHTSHPLIRDMILNPRPRSFNREQYIQFLEEYKTCGPRFEFPDINDLKTGDFITNFMGRKITYAG